HTILSIGLRFRHVRARQRFGRVAAWRAELAPHAGPLPTDGLGPVSHPRKPPARHCQETFAVPQPHQTVTPAAAASENYAALLMRLRAVAEAVVRGRRTADRREVTLRRWRTALSVVFTLLVGAGLLQGRVEAVPEAVRDGSLVAAVVSLLCLLLLHLYDAFKVG